MISTILLGFKNVDKNIIFIEPINPAPIAIVIKLKTEDLSSGEQNV